MHGDLLTSVFASNLHPAIPPLKPQYQPLPSRIFRSFQAALTSPCPIPIPIPKQNNCNNSIQCSSYLHLAIYTCACLWASTQPFELYIMYLTFSMSFLLTVVYIAPYGNPISSLSSVCLFHWPFGLATAPVILVYLDKGKVIPIFLLGPRAAVK